MRYLNHRLVFLNISIILWKRGVCVDSVIIMWQFPDVCVMAGTAGIVTALLLDVCQIQTVLNPSENVGAKGQTERGSLSSAHLKHFINIWKQFRACTDHRPNPPQIPTPQLGSWIETNSALHRPSPNHSALHYCQMNRRWDGGNDGRRAKWDCRAFQSVSVGEFPLWQAPVMGGIDRSVYLLTHFRRSLQCEEQKNAKQIDRRRQDRLGVCVWGSLGDWGWDRINITHWGWERLGLRQTEGKTEWT